jgi:hypothetical protein
LKTNGPRGKDGALRAAQLAARKQTATRS